MYHSNTTMPRKNIGLTADGEKRKPKLDTKVNGKMNLEAVKANEKAKVTLRIDSKTIILVSPENCNKEYAKQYLENKMRVHNSIIEGVIANATRSK